MKDEVKECSINSIIRYIKEHYDMWDDPYKKRFLDTYIKTFAHEEERLFRSDD